jgi:ATP-dependent Clp protease ATP-binding subunit ClpC
VAKVHTRLKPRSITFRLTPEATEFLIEKGYDPQYGARPLRRAVERYLEDPMAEEILRGSIKNGDFVVVSTQGEKDDKKLSFTVGVDTPAPVTPSAPSAS